MLRSMRVWNGSMLGGWIYLNHPRLDIAIIIMNETSQQIVIHLIQDKQFPVRKTSLTHTLLVCHCTAALLKQCNTPKTFLDLLSLMMSSRCKEAARVTTVSLHKHAGACARDFTLCYVCCFVRYNCPRRKIQAGFITHLYDKKYILLQAPRARCQEDICHRRHPE